LVTALSVNAVGSAPVGLGTVISAGAIASTAAHTATTVGTIKGLAMTTMQKILITVALTTAVGAGIYENRHASYFRTQVEGLQQKQEMLEWQISQSQQERDEAVTAMTALRLENQQLHSNFAELPRLRGEVAKLRENARQFTQSNP